MSISTPLWEGLDSDWLSEAYHFGHWKLIDMPHGSSLALAAWQYPLTGSHLHAAHAGTVGVRDEIYKDEGSCRFFFAATTFLHYTTGKETIFDSS